MDHSLNFSCVVGMLHSPSVSSLLLRITPVKMNSLISNLERCTAAFVEESSHNAHVGKSLFGRRESMTLNKFVEKGESYRHTYKKVRSVWPGFQLHIIYLPLLCFGINSEMLVRLAVVAAKGSGPFAAAAASHWSGRTGRIWCLCIHTRPHKGRTESCWFHPDR